MKIAYDHEIETWAADLKYNICVCVWLQNPNSVWDFLYCRAKKIPQTSFYILVGRSSK